MPRRGAKTNLTAKEDERRRESDELALLCDDLELKGECLMRPLSQQETEGLDPRPHHLGGTLIAFAVQSPPAGVSVAATGNTACCAACTPLLASRG